MGLSAVFYETKPKVCEIKLPEEDQPLAGDCEAALRKRREAMPSLRSRKRNVLSRNPRMRAARLWLPFVSTRVLRNMARSSSSKVAPPGGMVTVSAP